MKKYIMVILCVLALLLSTPMNIGGTITGTSPPSSGNWEISDNTVITDEMIDFNGSIIIHNGGSLTLDNSTLKIDSKSEGEFGIVVETGGAIYIKSGSTIDRSGVYNYYFIVREDATFEMKNSTIMHCGYENLLDYRYTGLYIECNAIIEYSTIDYCQQGVIAENETLYVNHSTISHSYWHNVEGRDATLYLDHCTFNATSVKCNVEFYEGCTGYLTNSKISNGGSNNIWSKTNVVATIENNNIWGASKNGIWADDSCDLTITNNNIHNNTRSGLWINDSTVDCNGNTIIYNGKPEEDSWDESGHGFAGFNSDVTFEYNTVGYNYGHNFETTDSTATFENNTFYKSIMKCNVEFFEGSVVIAKNNYIDGAGHNCFWVRDYVTATIENNIMKNSPHNGIWAGNGCILTIKNNVIDTCEENGIYAYNSTLTITDNEIKNCKWWGIHTEGCTITQSGNTYTSVTKGQIYQTIYVDITIKDDNEAPLHGATVTIKDASDNTVWTGTTDANGQTPTLLLDSYKVDIGGTPTDYSYTIEAEKGDLEGTMPLSPDQNWDISMSLASAADGDGTDGEEDQDLTLIIILVVVIIIIVVGVAAVAAMKKGKKPES